MDGSAVTAGAPIELNPGPHRARIASGSRQREVEFRVAARSHEQIELSLNEPEVPRALIDPPLTRRPAPALPPPPRSPAHGALYLPGWALVGTGAAAVVAGGIVGALALDKRASLEDSRDAKLRADSCRQQTCLTSQRAAVETHFAPAHRLAVASDVLWISGAVVALTGVTLLLLDKPAREAPSAALHLYPGGGTFEARF